LLRQFAGATLDPETGFLQAVGMDASARLPYHDLVGLGRGGMGTVWRAKRADGRDCVLKFGSSSPGLVASGQLAREARVLAALAEVERIPKLLALETIDDRLERRRAQLRESPSDGEARHPRESSSEVGGPEERQQSSGVGATKATVEAVDRRELLVLDWIEGACLYAVSSAGATLPGSTNPRVPLASALAISRGLAAILDAMHARGFAHGDVAPRNVLLDCAGQPWLIDFGVAAPFGGWPELVGIREGITGTPEYLAVERLDGDPPSAEADAYALAVLAFELVYAQHPFAPELAFAHDKPSRRAALRLATQRVRAGRLVRPARNLAREDDRDWWTAALSPDPGQRTLPASAFAASLAARLELG